MKAPPWIKGADATVAELEQQLADATQEHDAAGRAVAEAREALDRDPGGGEKSLQAALQHERSTAELLGRAQRLLTAGQARDLAKRRAELEARAAKISAQLTHDAQASLRAPSLEREVCAWREVVEARASRREVEEALRKLRSELRGIQIELHGDGAGGSYSDFANDDLEPATHQVRQLLEDWEKTLDPEDPRRRYSARLRHNVA